MIRTLPDVMLAGPMDNSKTRPAPIRTDESNAFAHYTMAKRLPPIIGEIIELNADYHRTIRRALEELKAEVEGDLPIRSIAPPAPDWGSWEEQCLRHRNDTWLHSEWFFAEHLYYRRIVEAVRWWETGRDPFASIKAQEYASDSHRALLDAGISLLESGGEIEARLRSLLLLDLWGNRVDLSYKASAALGAGTATAEDLIADDSSKVVELLLGDSPSKNVHIVTDNAGSELTMDLMLADLLVGAGLTVHFHVKMHPTYVSDTTAPDILVFLRRLCQGAEGRDAERIGRRLDGAFQAGSIRILPDLYWNSGRFLDELPPRLAEPFRSARFVILKGDVNYRRLSRDTVWPADSSVREVAGTLPAPLALIRTMKSDTVFGLPAGLAERLDAEDREWRSNGRRGLIQFFR